MRINQTNRTMLVETLPPITQGENNAHAEVIVIPRAWSGYDVAELTVVLRAFWPDYDTIMDQVLTKTVEPTQVLAVWRVTSDFTGYAGEMRLELRLFADDTENPVIKFPGSTPVTVRASGDHSDAVPPSLAESLLLQIETATNQATDASSAAASSQQLAGVYADRAAASAAQAAESAGTAAAESEKAQTAAKEALAIRDSTEVFYEIDGDRVGFRRADESAFTYTQHLTGPQGPRGETGSGLEILGRYASYDALLAAHPTGNAGDAYAVGDSGGYDIYIWDPQELEWMNMGRAVGVDGKSAYDAAVEGGFTQSEDVFNQTLASAAERLDELEASGAAKRIPITADDAGWTLVDGEYVLSIESTLFPTSVYRLENGAYHVVACDLAFDGSVITITAVAPFDGTLMIQIPYSGELEVVGGREGNVPVIGENGQVKDSGRSIDQLGATGPTGAAGKSAYEYAQEGGYTGTEAEFASLLANICEGPIIGSYTGDGAASRSITLGFEPRCGIVYATSVTQLFQDSYFYGYSVSSFGFFSESGDSQGIVRSSTGFTVSQIEGNAAVPTLPWLNATGIMYAYFVWR